MKRREFIQYVNITGLGWVSLNVFGCGPHVETGELKEDVTMRDIRMEGWSTLGSGFLGNDGILKAEEIKANKALNKTYIQDPHGHKYVITPEHLLELRQGKVVEILTTEALGHKHRVRIDPRNVISTSQPLTMPIVITDGPAQPADPQFFAAVSGQDAPTIHVAAENWSNAEICVTQDVETACSNWAPMKKVKDIDRRSFFTSLDRLAVRDKSIVQVRSGTTLRRFRLDRQ
jgi:hypothetical protein